MSEVGGVDGHMDPSPPLFKEVEEIVVQFPMQTLTPDGEPEVLFSVGIANKELESIMPLIFIE